MRRLPGRTDHAIKNRYAVGGPEPPHPSALSHAHGAVSPSRYNSTVRRHERCASAPATAVDVDERCDTGVDVATPGMQALAGAPSPEPGRVTVPAPAAAEPEEGEVLQAGSKSPSLSFRNLFITTADDEEEGEEASAARAPAAAATPTPGVAKVAKRSLVEPSCDEHPFGPPSVQLADMPPAAATALPIDVHPVPTDVSTKANDGEETTAIQPSSTPGSPSEPPPTLPVDEAAGVVPSKAFADLSLVAAAWSAPVQTPTPELPAAPAAAPTAACDPPRAAGCGHTRSYPVQCSLQRTVVVSPRAASASVRVQRPGTRPPRSTPAAGSPGKRKSRNANTGASSPASTLAWPTSAPLVGGVHAQSPPALSSSLELGTTPQGAALHHLSQPTFFQSVPAVPMASRPPSAPPLATMYSMANRVPSYVRVATHSGAPTVTTTSTVPMSLAGRSGTVRAPLRVAYAPGHKAKGQQGLYRLQPPGKVAAPGHGVNGATVQCPSAYAAVAANAMSNGAFYATPTSAITSSPTHLSAATADDLQPSSPRTELRSVLSAMDCDQSGRLSTAEAAAATDAVDGRLRSFSDPGPFCSHLGYMQGDDGSVELPIPSSAALDILLSSSAHDPSAGGIMDLMGDGLTCLPDTEAKEDLAARLENEDGTFSYEEFAELLAEPFVV